MEPERVDLSSIDPARDGDTWERLVADIARKGFAARQRPPSLFDLLAAWVRPAAVVAAILAVVAIGLSGLDQATGQHQTAAPDPVTLLLSWAGTGRMPEVPQVLSAFGGDHDKR